MDHEADSLSSHARTRSIVRYVNAQSHVALQSHTPVDSLRTWRAAAHEARRCRRGLPPTTCANTRRAAWEALAAAVRTARRRRARDRPPEVRTMESGSVWSAENEKVGRQICVLLFIHLVY